MMKAARTIRGVVFDMDGTLTIPFLNFKEMRRRLDLHASDDIVHKLNEWTGERRVAAERIIREMEEEALANTQLQPNVHKLLGELQSLRIPLAILTRNAMPSVAHVLENHLPQYRFSPIITRDFVPTKPAPDPLLHIARAWGYDPRELIMVGDAKDDLACGTQAGAVTVLLMNEANRHLQEHATIAVSDLGQVTTALVERDIVLSQA
ncbi:HAD-like domain-containing protein [Polychytrium aggregatum]|uniref:HAD-like domain-containing protein n=1 Tax=Polychytrium aggregatum TaxID=110093 RepID=UPI0022FE58A4|nr:HAD-like domain-containing protein [Polychytrium aggregatum]KAI9207944.1 HAD-like domain-containing protein [Polychytrium aggregatum]